MCGRYLLDVPGSDLANFFTVDENRASGFAPVYNAAPTQQLPVIVSEESKSVLETMRWGLLPLWAARQLEQGGASKIPSSGWINARAETVATQPAFRKAFAQRRCLVPASGFYEWMTAPSAAVGPGAKGKAVKTPFCIRPLDRQPIAFAGVYEQWVNTEGELARSFAIVTTTPSGDVKDIHDRMPVILEGDAAQAWVEPRTGEDDVDDLLDLLKPFRGGALETYEVSRDVNSARNDHPGLAEPVHAAGPADETLF
jgi:putative SOS response-associated peptidase YedK